MKPVMLLLMSVVSASAGQVFFKKGVLATGEILFKGSVIGEVVKLVFQPLVFLGLVFYSVSTILWLVALSKTTLNFAYPFTALTFALVMFSARIVFQEPIPTWRYLGILLICLGIFLSSAVEG